MIQELATLEMYTLYDDYDFGDTVDFYVNASFAFNFNIEITDLNDFLYETITVLEDTHWVRVGDYSIVPYQATFELPSTAATGTWNWTAIDTDFAEEVANGTFTVGEPVGPPPDQPTKTTGEDTLDPDGVPKDSFAPGDTITISADITNQESEDQPVIVVFQLFDAAYRPLPIFSFRTTLTPGQVMTLRPDFLILTTGYTAGTWTAEINVLDDWPAQGGIAIALPVIIEFEVS